MAVDVIIDPLTGQIYWNDSQGTAQSIAISGNGSDLIKTVGYSLQFSAAPAGTITSGSATTAVTGSGTNFLTLFGSGAAGSGAVLYTLQGTSIGTVSTVASDTSLTLSSNASGSYTSINFRYSPPSGTDRVIFSDSATPLYPATTGANLGTSANRWALYASTIDASSNLTFTSTSLTASSLTTLDFGSTVTSTSTLNIGTGVVTSATKTINIGTGGTTTATTTITLGTTAGTSTIALNGTVTLSSPLAIAQGGTGTSSAPTQWGIIFATSTSQFASTGASAAAGSLLHANSGAAPTLTTTLAGQYTMSPSAGTGTQNPVLTITSPAHTALTASTEHTSLNFNLSSTIQFATGAITTLRAFRLQAPTYSFQGASTVTNAAALQIDSAPVAGTNATLTETAALRVLTGTTVGKGVVVRGAASQTGNLFEAQNSTPTTIWNISAAGNETISPAASTGTQSPELTITGPAHTALTASTEFNDINFNFARTIQFATGAITTLRAFRVQAPTYGFQGASTVTNAATLQIDSAPVAGTNATLTETAALRVLTGTSAGKGLVVRGSASQSVDLVDIQNSSGASLFEVASTGVVNLGPIGASAGNTNELRFLELAASGVNFSAFKSADAMANDIQYTLPSATPTTNQVLTASVVSGTTVTLSWVNSSGSGTVSSGTATQVAYYSGATTTASAAAMVYNAGASNSHLVITAQATTNTLLRLTGIASQSVDLFQVATSGANVFTVGSAGISTFANSTAATTTTSGALIITGGIGVGSTSYLSDLFTVGTTLSATSATTINLGTSAATKTINIGTGGTSSHTTSITIGTTAGTSTLTIESPTVATNTTSLTLFNANATTVNAFGAATALTLGFTTGTTTIRNTTVTLTNATSITGTSAAIAMFGESTSFTLMATTATSTTNIASGNNGTNAKTLNLATGGAGTGVVNVNVGSSTGTFTVNSATSNIGTTAVSGTVAILSSSFTANNATTFSATSATTLGLGSTTGTTTIRNTTVSFANATNITGTTGTLALLAEATTVTAYAAVTSGTFFGTTGTTTVNLVTGDSGTNTKTINLGTGGTGTGPSNINLGISTGTFTVNSAAANIGTTAVAGTIAILSSTFTANNATTFNVTSATSFSLSSGVTGASTLNIGTGAVTSATKTINIGTGAASGGTTAITIGTTTGTSTTTINGNLVLSAALPVGQGGTGTSTAPTQWGIIFATSASQYSSTAAGTNNQWLRAVSSGAPTWSTATLATTFTQYDLLYASGSNAVTGLANTNTSVLVSQTAGPVWLQGATGNRLLKTNGSTISWSQVDLASGDVTGVLPIANGGTQTSSITVGGVVYMGSTAATGLQALSPAAANKFLVSTGTATTNYPAWSTATLATTYASGDLLYASSSNTVGGLTSTATSVLITQGAASPSWLQGATGNRLLKTSGSAISWGQVDLGTGDITGTLPITSGGLGTTTFTQNGVLYGNLATSVLVTAQSGAVGAILQTTTSGGAPTFSNTLAGRYAFSYSPTTGTSTNNALSITGVPFAEASGALIEIGAATAFDGSTSNHFGTVATSNGTYHAIWAASGYSGNYAMWGQADGNGSRFSIGKDGVSFRSSSSFGFSINNYANQNILVVDTSNGRLGVNIPANYAFDLRESEGGNANTSSAIVVQNITRRTSGTASAGIGAGILFTLENAAASDVASSRIDGILSDVGASYLGALVFNTNTAGSATMNERVRIDNTGMSISPIGTSAGNTGELRFMELAAQGSNYIAFKAPDDIATTYTYVLPSAAPSAGQLLSASAPSAGVVTLSWATDQLGTSGGGITSLNLLSAASQSFANDTNVTITSATATHTLGWQGTLAVGRGGTGTSTAPTQWGVAYGLSASALAYTGAGTSGQLLLAVTSNAPQWGTMSGDASIGNTGVVTIANSAVTFAKMQNSAAAGLSVIGRSANTAGAFAEIATTTDGAVLRLSGTTLGFGSINLATTNAVTGILPAGNGGTGTSSFTINTILTSGATTTGAITTATALGYSASNQHLTITAQGAATSPLRIVGTTSQTADLFQVFSTSAGTALGSVGAFGGATFTSLATSATTPATALVVTGAAHTALNTATEYSDVYFNLGQTKTFATGGITTLRTFRVAPATYAFSGASTVTNAATFQIDGAPTAGTNATLTEAAALRILTGTASGKGLVIRGATSQTGNYIDVQNNSGTSLVTLGTTNINLAPHGASAGNTFELRFSELAATGSNYIAFKAPDDIATTYTYVLPSAAPSAGQLLSASAPSAGVVTLSWATDQLGTSGGGITSLNLLSAASQSFANDTNVTITSATATHTLGWQGELAISRGGTGTSTAPTQWGVMFATSSTAIRSTAAAGSTNQWLASVSAGAPVWSTATLATTYAAGDLLYASSGNVVGGLTSTATSVLITQGAAAPSWLQGATGNRLLKTSGSVISWGQVDLASGDVTGTLAIGSGGTGTSTAPTQWGVMFATSASAIRSTAAGTANQWLAAVTGGAPVWSTATLATTFSIGQFLYASGANAVTGLTTTTLSVDTTNIRIGIGTSAASSPLHILNNGTGTNAVVVMKTIDIQSAGTPANGFGGSILFDLESTTTAAQDAASIETVWATATHATRLAELNFKTNDVNTSTLAERMSISNITTAQSSTNATVVITGTLGVNSTSYLSSLSLNTALAIASGGTNTSSFATTNGLVYFNGTNLLTTNAAASGVLVTNGSNVPSIGTDIPTAVTIGGGYIYRGSGTDVPLADGGTNASLAGVAGGVVYSTASAMAITTAGSSGQPLLSGGSGAPSFGTLGMGAGGTGLTTTTPGANYVLGMNASNNGLEYKQLVQGSNITITHAANSVTITASGGSATPGGSNTQIQFNSAGALGGISNFTYVSPLLSVTNATNFGTTSTAGLELKYNTAAGTTTVNNNSPAMDFIGRIYASAADRNARIRQEIQTTAATPSHAMVWSSSYDIGTASFTRVLSLHSVDGLGFWNYAGTPGSAANYFKTGNQASDIRYTWPTAVPTANQVLSATGVSGSDITLGWATASGGSGTVGSGTANQLAYYSGATTTASDASLVRAATGTHLTITAQGATTSPLKVVGAASQSAALFTVATSGADVLVVGSAGAITTGTWNASTIGVLYGGTGQTTYTDGQLLIGNSTGNTLTKATLTAGSGVAVTNGSGSITVRQKRPLTLTFCSGYTPAATGADSVVLRIPDSPADGTTSLTYNLRELFLRVETPSAGTSTVQVEYYTGTSAFSATNLLSSALSATGASTYEFTSSGFSTSTLASGTKLRLNFTAINATHANFFIQLLLEEN